MSDRCRLHIRTKTLGSPRRASTVIVLLLIWAYSDNTVADTSARTLNERWQQASQRGDYDTAVKLATRSDIDTPLARVIQAANRLNLADTPQWRAFLHYKPALTAQWLSQVDSDHFFLSDQGKRSPQAELNATLAAFFSNQKKPPLRLSPYCRFVARRYWLTEQLPEFSTLVPQQPCPEFDRYVDYLDASVLTLIFPSAHPNSPSSAFGHTLLRIDKEKQRPESRLLNMSINFAAEVPPEVSGAAYAIGGLSGGFPGRFRLLPYHMKLREYGQIENRDTWEYPLILSKSNVDLVLRHTYEMLISDFDYYFFSENCSYHLLSLLDVAFPDEPLTEHFGLWTIPVDTIRVLKDRKLVSEAQFVPSSIRTLRARREQLLREDATLALHALQNGVDVIDTELSERSPARQAGILDLLSDYERYERLKLDPGAQASSPSEKAILSRRSQLGVRSEQTKITEPEASPDQGHGTSRLSLHYHNLKNGSNSIELQFRPAYHDFRDPSAAFDDKAAIEMGLIGIARDTVTDQAFLRRFTIVRIASVEPRDDFFKPVSWHTNLMWERPQINARHQSTFNVGAGIAVQPGPGTPVVFVFGESDLVDAPAFKQRHQWRLGVSAGAHWEPFNGFRTGLELEYRQQIGNDYSRTSAEAWLGFAITDNWSINVDLEHYRESGVQSQLRTSTGVRFYF